MRLASFVLVALAALIYGCSSTLTGPQTINTGSLSSYFWPDSNATYSYVTDVDGHTHSLIVTKGAGVRDSDWTTGSVTPFGVLAQGGKTTVNGFGSGDIFNLDQTLAVVADTNPKALVSVKSIASLNGYMYAVNNTAFYIYSSPVDTLQNICPLPASVTNPKLFEDPTQSQSKRLLFCVNMGGREIYSYAAGAPGLQAQLSAPKPIDAFTVGYDPHFRFWVASGNEIRSFDATTNSYGSPVVLTTTGKIVAMEKESGGSNGDELLIGLDNGEVWSIDHNGNPNREDQLHTKVNAIEAGYIATDAGLFGTVGPGPRQNLVPSGSIVSLYASGYYLFMGYANDSVGGLVGFSQQLVSYGAPGPYPAAQFATDKNYLYALVRNKIYSLHNSSWAKRAQGNARWRPGGLVMLQDGAASWDAGWIENLAGYDDIPYDYVATVVIPNSSIKLDGVTYDNSIAVRYTAKANGINNNTTMPEYTIFYQYGFGPWRIEKVEGGIKHITRFVY